jgi:tetratricopeptide (TPR) repeat protein
MAIGALHVLVLAAVTVVLTVAAVLTWWQADALRARRSASLVLWVGVALVAWTAISIVPLPLRWLTALSPHAADVWSRALTPLNLPGPLHATLSLDPGATRVQVLRGVAYCLAFLAAARISARREGVVFLERAICATVIALALAAIIHPALGAEKVFGIYTPRHDPSARHVAPILNPNVLSEYLNIGLALLMGQLLAPRSVWPRSLLTSLVVALVAVEVWVASRGGMLGMALCMVLVLWMSRSHAVEMRGIFARFLVPALLAIAGLGATVLASTEGPMGELATLETSKLDLSRAAFRLVPDFPLFGVGRGAFESVYPAYRTDPSFVVYVYPENVVAQWITEWGLPSAIAIVLLIFALRPQAALARSPRAAGAWTALVCVAAQNLVDFGSEYPAVMIALATCAGIVTGGTSGTDDDALLDVWARRPDRVVPAMLVAAAFALGLAVPTWKHDLYQDRLALHAAALDPSLPRAEFESLAEASMLRHPAEPYLPFTGALHAARTDNGTLIAWIERTLDRALVYGPAHVLLARWLAARSPSQARLEYRLAIEQAPEFTRHVEDTVPALVHSYDDALELLPRNQERLYWVNHLATKLSERLPATAQRLDALALELDPGNRTATERRAEQGLRDVMARSNAPWCEGAGRAACFNKAKDDAARLIQVAPGECVGHAIHARLVALGGSPAEGLRELRAAADSVSDRIHCFKELANVATTFGSDDMVTQALDRLAHAGCADPRECVKNLEFVAQYEEGRKNQRSALAAMQRARALAPDDDSLLEQVAILASRADMHAEALKSYQALAARHATDPRWPAGVQAEKLALMKGAIPY